MRRVSPDFIEQVRLANDIVDIIGEDTFLKNTGGGSRYMGLCPFHEEKNPSFSVAQDKQVYHCFSCGQSGNTFTYLQVKKGLSFMEALEYLAKRSGISWDMDDPENTDNNYVERKTLLKINQLAIEFYENNLQSLPDNHYTKKYLQKRNLSSDTIKQFRLGYATTDWKAFLNYITKKRMNLDLVMKLGLIKKKNNNYYDMFRDRLMFPVLDKNGKDVLGFGGRALGDAKPKYINSQDSSIFQKGKTFYGWQCSVPAIREKGKALVVEGYTDYLSLYQRGIKNVVATLGTALTKHHAKTLSYYTDQVILFFDGDQAGKKASERSLSILLSYNLAPKWLSLEDGMDPDSFIQKYGKEVLEKKVDHAKDLFLYLFLEDLKNHPVGIERLNLIQKVASVLTGITKTTLKEYYVDRVLDSFGYDEKLAKRALTRALKKERLKNNRSHNNKDVFFWDKDVKNDLNHKKTKEDINNKKNYISLKEAPKAEIYLAILALENSEYYKFIEEMEGLKKLSHKGVSKVFDIIKECKKESWDSIEELTPMVSAYLLDPRELQKAQYPSLTYLSSKKVKTFIQDCINKVEKNKERSRLKNITANMRLDGENTEKYLLKIAEWTKNSKNKENNI